MHDSYIPKRPPAGSKARWSNKSGRTTYTNQPLLQKTGGEVPEGGLAAPYTVTRVLWPRDVEAWIGSRIVGTSLHLCCGHSRLGDVRLDLDPRTRPDLLADAAFTPLPDKCFDTVVCDPPYTGVFKWQHALLWEISRLARRRIIFQQWFLPFNKTGHWRKDPAFRLVELVNWPPKSYFGRVQVIAVLDHV